MKSFWIRVYITNRRKIIVQWSNFSIRNPLLFSDWPVTSMSIYITSLNCYIHIQIEISNISYIHNILYFCILQCPLLGNILLFKDRMLSNCSKLCINLKNQQTKFRTLEARRPFFKYSKEFHKNKYSIKLFYISCWVKTVQA